MPMGMMDEEGGFDKGLLGLLGLKGLKGLKGALGLAKILIPLLKVLFLPILLPLLLPLALLLLFLLLLIPIPVITTGRSFMEISPTMKTELQVCAVSV